MSEATQEAQAQRDAKAAAAEALRNLRKSTALPRELQFMTGESLLLESREPAPKPWADV
ncbi:hypothetical protein [Mycobacterium avium]|uniref:hypothetical protein n=1 Tax=Mycobacterium avium TaxID=1764 RepID=UPI000AF1FAB5|nr:hypothetical protein [Mycobacterium avium]WOF20784.1 hypothetical protein IHV82_09920 [Mycobacterium avium]